MRRGLLLLLAAAALTGCQGDCQSFCRAYAEYAEECGLSFSEDDIQECMEDHAAATPEEEAACRDDGRPDRLRRNYTCDDILLFQELPK